MGFLIRAAFWFSLVLLFLPLDGGDSNQGETVGPLQALFAAREAISDLTGICERKPEVCETCKSALHTIGVRARAAYDMVDGGLSEPDSSVKTGTLAPAVPEPEDLPVAPVPQPAPKPAS